jgi:hypothetical protein
MDLDIRIPIGLMFLLLGPILLVTGLVQQTTITQATGGAMIAFGAPMLIFGWKGARKSA